MRILAIVLLATLGAAPGSSVSAQDPQPVDSKIQIQVDVNGRAIDDSTAARTKKKTDWIELRSRNFVVVGDANLDDIRLAASEAELFRDRFAQLFPRAKELSSVPTRIVVFRDKQSLKQFGPLDEAGASSDQPYFRQNSDINYLVLTSGNHLSHDIMRGLVREFVRDSINPVPLWFQEALGEYFTSFKIGRLGNDRVVKMGLDEYKQKLNEKQLMPLSFLFTVSPDDFDAMNPDTKKFFVSESCSLFEYLLQNRRITATLKMINDMADGKPVAQSFRNAFKLSLPIFEENFRRDIKVSKMKGWRVTFTGLSLDPNKRIILILWGRGTLKLPVNFDTIRAQMEILPVRLLTEAQTETYRGDLLFHSNRLDDAESHLRHAIELDGSLSAAYASLGAVKSEQQDYASAQDFIDKALRADPENYLSYYYDAALIRRQARESGVNASDDALKEMSAALTRSVKIAPEFVETTELLAETQRIMHGDLSASTKLLLTGLKRAPGRESLLMEMAKTAAEAGQKPTAGWILQRLILSVSADDRMKQEARDFLNQLNLTPEQRTEVGGITVGDSGNDAVQGFSVRLVSKDDRKRLAKIEKAQNPGKVVRGRITKVDCSKGMTIYIRIGTPGIDERIENLHSDTPERIDWVTDNGETIEFIACGETKIGGSAAITYTPKRKGLMMGEPMVVEMLRLPE